MEKKSDQFRPVKALFIARSDYGKSYLISEYIIQLVKNKSIEPNRIICFSKTFKSDASQQRYIKHCNKIYKEFENKNCHEVIDMDLIVKLYEGQKAIKDEGREPKPFLLVMDDMISEKLLTGKGPFISIYSLMRHYNISIILSLQGYRSTLSGLLRDQVTLLALGAISSQSSTEDVLSEIDGGLSDSKRQSLKIITAWYQNALASNNNHGFLTVNITQSPWQGKKYQRNFDGIFYDTP